MTELVDAVLRGPDPYFHTDGVLYHPGQVVPDVRADWVSHHDSREVTVKAEGPNGKLRDRVVQKPVLFRPLSEEQQAAFRVQRERALAAADEQPIHQPTTGFMAGS